MRLFETYRDVPADARGAALALGNFDGVHLGHRAVIARAAQIARAEGRPFGAVTFEPHPRQLFRPSDPPFRLTTARTKARLIERLGADLLFMLPFDRAFSQMSAEDFVKDVLVGHMGVAHIAIGHDFHFGRGRAGTPTLLSALGEQLGFGVSHVPDVVGPDGHGISSSRIRDLLRAGDPIGAARLLGDWWEISGPVLPGDRRGRTIGFPTANLELGELLEPALGVYAVRALVDGREMPAVANLGRRPTVDGTRLLLEVHLFDFAGDLYGRELRARMVDFLRPERRFPGLDALKAQIAEDAAEARRRLAAMPEAPPGLGA